MSRPHSFPTSSAVSRRRFIGIGGALAAGGLLAACGGEEPVTGGGGDAAPASTLGTTSGASGSIRILDDNTNPVFLNGVVEAFQNDTGITVEYEQANFNDLHDRLATLFSAQDSSYDVVMTWAAWSAEFGQAGWLQALGSDAVPTDLLPAALDAVSWNGTVYGLPKFASAQTMFYNKELFRQAGLDPEAPPATWDEFVAAAKALTTGDRYGFTCDMGNTDGAYQNFVRTLLLNGGQMYGDDNTVTFNDERGVEALTKLRDLLTVDKVMNPSSLQITNASDLGTLFGAGQTGIVFNWPSQWAAATKEGAVVGRENTGNAIIPGISVTTASIDGSEGFAINQFSQNKPAALAWLQYVTQRPVQTRIVEEEGWFPVTTTLLDDAAITETLPVVSTYKEQSDFEIRRYGSPWYSDVTQVLSTNISRAMLEQATPQEALDEAAARATDIVERYTG
ncbi:extracellular solute-binding protein [Nakamurella leprariae]|uniref:Extracellular solute-binding protein n=1 Tax=Nakamurella leprariae TaxID=2803911 RepID=A0A938YG91_9ACTN|nr:extracellular solute-binding protein [Nakamurella leprariae]MBM9469033.1 extracellular solute-binding protein [Nakamurella leprariae]